MEITIRDAEWIDLQTIIHLCSPEGRALAELQDYWQRHFTVDGKMQRPFTGYPEEVWVAEYDGRIVGYLHFFVDCWEGYEYVILSLRTAASLSAENALEVRGQLEEALRLREP